MATVKVFHHDTKVHAEEIARAHNSLEQRFNQLIALINQNQFGSVSASIPQITASGAGTVS